MISLLANVLARQQAVEDGCAEALLIRDGWLKEGAASNIFVVKNGVLLAPPKTHLMLPGITYDIILELAESRGLPLEIREIHRNGTSQRRRGLDDLIDQGSPGHHAD